MIAAICSSRYPWLLENGTQWLVALMFTEHYDLDRTSMLLTLDHALVSVSYNIQHGSHPQHTSFLLLLPSLHRYPTQRHNARTPLCASTDYTKVM